MYDSDVGGQEIADHRRDFIGVGFQREMACIEEPDVSVTNVPLEQFGSHRQEEWIVLSPNCKEMRLVRPEIGLESRIQRDVALVGAKMSSWISSAPGRLSYKLSNV
jgi:hypothetical protein